MANSVTTPRDNIQQDIRSQGSKLNYPLGGSGVSFDFFQGDLLYWDSTAKYVKPLDSDAHAANLVGVAARSAYLAPYASVLQSGGPAMVKIYDLAALVWFGVVATFYSTAGETYNDGDSVYWGGVANNPQTIQKGVGTHQVGVVKLPPGGSAIAGGATILVPVLVIPQTPIQTL